MLKTRYTVKCLRDGQPRPYADTERVYKVLCEREAESASPGAPIRWEPMGIERQEDLRGIVRALCCTFFDDPEWHQPRLKSLSQTNDGIIHVHVVDPYVD